MTQRLKAAQTDYVECCGCVLTSMTSVRVAVVGHEGHNTAAQLAALLGYGLAWRLTCMTSSLDHHIRLPDLLVRRIDCFRWSLWRQRLLDGSVRDADVAQECHVLVIVLVEVRKDPSSLEAELEVVP